MDFFNQARYVGGIVLQIAIHRNDDVTLGKIKARRHCGGLAEVPAEADDL